jgi:hypothetical protein
MTEIHVFWIAGNTLFDLQTGGTTNVLMLVKRAEDATTFKLEDANAYCAFVSERAQHLRWSVTPSAQNHELFVIMGVQHV